MANLETNESTTSPDPIPETIAPQTINPPVDTSQNKPPSPGLWPFLRILAYLSFVIAITLAMAILVFPEYFKLLTIVIILCISLCIFLFPINRELKANYTKKFNDYNVVQAREMYITISQLEESPKGQQIRDGVDTALGYTEELLEKYKGIRIESRFFYYLLQITTIIFSAVTPILVLVEKSPTAPSWVKWLPIIFPAIASIVASLSTAFPLEENLASANKAIDDLESEKKEFLLGVTAGYRIPRYAEERERYKKTRDAMAKFMNQVKAIHLKQLQEEDRSEEEVESRQDQQQQQQQQQEQTATATVKKSGQKLET